MKANANLHGAAMLANITIGVWDANITDRNASAVVVEKNHVQKKSMARVRKSLLPRVNALATIDAIHRQARLDFYQFTLPWKKGSDRLLPIAAYAEFQARMVKHRDGFEAAVKELIGQYDDLKRAARIQLGDLYREEDYPSAAEMAGRFFFNGPNYEPIPQASHFEVDIESAEMDSIQKTLEGQVQANFESAQAALWQRMYDAISTAYEKLSSADAQIRVNTFNKLAELVDLLPSLNIMGDERLTSLAAQMKDKLLSTSSVSLATSPDVRAACAADVGRIQSMMASFMRTSAEDTDIEEDEDETYPLAMAA